MKIIDKKILPDRQITEFDYPASDSEWLERLAFFKSEVLRLFCLETIAVITFSPSETGLSKHAICYSLPNPVSVNCNKVKLVVNYLPLSSSLLDSVINSQEFELGLTVISEAAEKSNTFICDQINAFYNQIKNESSTESSFVSGFIFLSDDANFFNYYNASEKRGR